MTIWQRATTEVLGGGCCIVIDIIALAALCKSAIEGGNRLLEEFKKRRLSEAERELLVAAAEDGEFHIIQVNEAPDCIRAGEKHFPDDIAGDPAITEKYHDAFESLCKRGHLRHDDGILFRLTYAGFEKARQLVAAK